MDPSAAPWRVLDAAEPTTTVAGGEAATTQTPSLTAGLSISPLTVVGGAAVILLSRRSQVSEKQVLPKVA